MKTNKKKSENKFLETSLADLIDTFSKDDVIEQMEKAYSASSRSKLIPLDAIKDNHYLKNIKINQEAINSLSTYIQENGLYPPLLVKEVNYKYEIVLGRKRFFAAKQAEFIEVPCIIGDFREEEILLILLADSRDKRDTNVIEMAYLCKELSKRFKYTQSTLAKLSHQSRPQITNIMRLLSLPKDVVDDIVDGKLSYGHAKALVTLPESKIKDFVNSIYEGNLSVRDTENLLQIYRHRGNKTPSNELKKKFKAKRVDIRRQSVTFNFKNNKEVDEFILKIGKIK